MKAVFDTNILVSALFWRGAPYRCLLAAEAGLAELIVSPPILDELRTVLIRKFDQTSAEAEESVEFIAEVARSVHITGNLHVVADDLADDKFIETAWVGGAPYIVSGDRQLLTWKPMQAFLWLDLRAANRQFAAAMRVLLTRYAGAFNAPKGTSPP